MYQKIILLLSLFGITVGLLTGILDSFFHYIDFERFRLTSLFIFLLFFVSIYISTITIRNKFMGGYMTYVSAFRNSLYIGTIASLVIAVIRYVYLKYVAVIDIDIILNKTEQTMLSHYSAYKEELINNRLSFIEFSYDPVISSTMYFVYYMLFTLGFAIIASLLMQKIDRNISL